MIHTLKNDHLLLAVDTMGAQMKRIKSSGGRDYLWQGDATYWSDSAPLLFPFIARLYQKKHRVGDTDYSLDIHGFAKDMDFEAVHLSDESLLLRLQDTAETLAQYPFPFCFEVEYTLCDNRIEVTYHICNTGGDKMSFGIGGHPGFCVPFAPDSSFSDYYLAFDKPCTPDRVGFDGDLLLNGTDTPYPLEKEQYIPLRHDLFDDDAIILKNTARRVMLNCTRSRSRITVDFPEMPYLGIWHMPKTDAPYVCIEPWSSLPGRGGVVERFESRSDLIHLMPGERYATTWAIAIDEE